MGQKAKVVLREPVENQRQLGGQACRVSQGVVALEIAALEPSAGRLIHFPLEQVEKANLKFEW